ncbi:hypothetical protein D3C83_123620 [compost metagenome]
MLDHENGASLSDGLDEMRHAVDVFMAHPCRRLVEQHQFRIHGERRRDFERALAAVRQLHRHRTGETGDNAL